MAILLSVSENTISIIRTTSGVSDYHGHARHEENAGQEAHDQEELPDEQHTEVRNTRVNLGILLLY